MRVPITSILALTILAGWSTGALAQCAMCGNSFAQNDPTTGAFNTSVVFMMAAPYAIFLAAAGCFTLLYRRGMIGHRATVIPLSPRHPAVPGHAPKEITP
jgi:ABC-type methionine transport system permease subunit